MSGGRVVIISVLLFSVIMVVDAAGVDNKADSDTLAVRLEATGRTYGNGKLRRPVGLSADGRGGIYTADPVSGMIYRFSREEEPVQFERPPLQASFYPMDVTVYGAYIYVLEYSENRLLRYDRSGSYLDVLISFRQMERIRPVSLNAALDGRLISTDMENNRVRVWSPLLDTELSFGEYGWAGGNFNRPVDGIILPGGGIAIAEVGNSRVQLFSPNGKFERELELPDTLQFEAPRALAVDQEGNLFAGDSRAGRILVFLPGGEFAGSYNSFDGNEIVPVSMALGWNSYLYVSDLRSHSILVFRIIYPS